MGVPLHEVLNNISPQRQKKIQEKANEYIKEYKTLQELRKELNLTQTELAETLHVRQVSISNLENRHDMMISTLNSYIEAMGCELEILIKTPDQKHVKITNLFQKENRSKSG